MTDYATFLERKSQLGGACGFAPLWMPERMMGFQRHLTEWNLLRGRAATFADCGLGKSLMELAWAENVVRHTNRPVLILTPLAVAAQFVREGEKFGVECHKVRGGAFRPAAVNVTNYEQLHHYDPADFAGGRWRRVGRHQGLCEPPPEGGHGVLPAHAIPAAGHGDAGAE